MRRNVWPYSLALPETSRTSTTSSTFPMLTGIDVGGWLFLNLSSGATDINGCHATLSAQRAGFASATCPAAAPGASGSRSTTQNWVIVSIFGIAAADKFVSADFDAAWLGNGCTPERRYGETIAPASHFNGALVCPPNAAASNCAAGTKPAAVNP